MKKRIVVVLEVTSNSDDEFMIQDDFIRDDLQTEINCASNYYEVKSITISEVG